MKKISEYTFINNQWYFFAHDINSISFIESNESYRRIQPIDRMVFGKNTHGWQKYSGYHIVIN